MDLFADWIKEHANARFATFEQLMEADGVLCLSSMLKTDFERWYPRTYVYAEWGGRTIELFDAARDVRYAERLLVIFGESDIGTLKTKVKALSVNSRQTYGNVIPYLFAALGFEKWGTLQ